MEKPKFLTKAEREERDKKRAEEKKKQEEELKRANKSAADEYMRKGRIQRRELEWMKREEERIKRTTKRRRSRSRSRSRSREREKERLEKEKEKEREKGLKYSKDVPMNDQEIVLMKSKYLGTFKEKKKILKPSEKFQNNFTFDWDASEDTSQDINKFYSQRPDPKLLFGKGALGGIAKDEEKKDSKETGHFKTPSANKELSHWSKKEIKDMTSRDWRIFREDHDIAIKGGKVPLPIRSWEEGGLPDYVVKALYKAKYSKPMEIQVQAIPISMEKKDLIGVAPTGSGKSCAYLVPLVCYLSSLPPLNEKNYDDGPRALILAPTRELGIQIDEEFKKIALYTKLTSAVVVGGRNSEEQSNNLSRGTDIIIGTPGRIKDCLEKRYTVLNQCYYVILDEGDVMIDLGFEEDVKKILDQIPIGMKGESEEEINTQIAEIKRGEKHYRITQLYSATMPLALEKLAKQYLRCPLTVKVGSQEGGKKDIEQRVDFIGEFGKKHKLLEIMEESRPPIMVFVNQKKDAEGLARYIANMTRLRCATLHGDKIQDKREKALNGFKSGLYDVLVCTNLASRGLDVEGVTHVVNYDAPTSILDYIHRIGRTGRAGKKGIATTFLTNGNEEIFYDLRCYLAESKQKIPSELENHPAALVKPGGKQKEEIPRKTQVLYKA